MSDTPLEKSLSGGRGGRRFVAMGYAMRVIKTLPTPLRERLLDKILGGVTVDLPPFWDTLRLVEAAGGVPDGTLWQERLLKSRPHLAKVRTTDISDDRHGRVRGRLYLPAEDMPAPTAALVWVHGGAFIIGSLNQKEAHWPAMELAASGIPVFSVDYRMALNGVHYPAPQDDVLAAWRWATSNAERLGVQADQVHLGGASAGGCIVGGVALRLRDDGKDLPASVYLAYPVLEGTLPTATPEVAKALTVSGLPTDEWLAQMFANWAGDARWDDPLVAPGLADPTGLPPTYVLSCGVDPLRRGSEPYVERLQRAGIPVWHDLFQESRHAVLDEPDSTDGQHAIQRLQTWLTGGIAAMPPGPNVTTV